MTPVVVGIGVGLVAAIVIWLVVSIQRRTPEEEADRILAEARADARAIIDAAEATAADTVAAAEKVMNEARATAGRASAEIRGDAKRTARGIVKEAEERGLELVAELEYRRVEAEQELLRQRRLAARAQRELTEWVNRLLAQVGRPPERPARNGYALDDAPAPGSVGSRSAQSGHRAFPAERDS